MNILFIFNQLLRERYQCKMKYFKLLPKKDLEKFSWRSAITEESAQILRIWKKVESPNPRIIIILNWHKEELAFCLFILNSKYIIVWFINFEYLLLWQHFHDLLQISNLGSNGAYQDSPEYYRFSIFIGRLNHPFRHNYFSIFPMLLWF